MNITGNMLSYRIKLIKELYKTAISLSISFSEPALIIWTRQIPPPAKSTLTTFMLPLALLLPMLPRYMLFHTYMFPVMYTPIFPTLISYKLIQKQISTYDLCSINYVEAYLNTPEVQEALHAHVDGAWNSSL